MSSKNAGKQELGIVKISADGVYARLDEMQLQNTIQLSELPLHGKIHVGCQRIGSKTQVASASNQR